MKKNKIVLFAFIVLLIISAVSIGMNIQNAKRQDMIMRIMINRAYSELRTISLGLDGGLYYHHNPSSDPAYEIDRYSLNNLSRNFIKLDTVLKQYATCFPPKGIVRNVYANIFDFDFIATTLTFGTGVANDMLYNGILVDDVISETEIRYLEILRDDISLIVSAMESPDNPPNENQNLTVSQMDNILKTFFDKWSFHNEESPYFLLRAE